MYLYSRDSKLAYWQLLSVFRESSPLAWDPLAFELGCEVLALKVRNHEDLPVKSFWSLVFVYSHLPGSGPTERRSRFGRGVCPARGV